MIDEKFVRTSLILGSDNLLKLNNSKVLIFGLGGVGGHACEALVRSGIGYLAIVDSDTISVSNINRQLIAKTNTVGLKKVDEFEKRIHEINPDCIVEKHDLFYLPGSNEIDFSKFDYVIDAIDTVSAKIDIIENCYKLKKPIISSMGMGNKINPLDIEVQDIYKTSVCPLAKVMRNELKKRHINKLKVVYSKELPIKPKEEIKEGTKVIPGSISFTPSVAGLIIASEVIKDITGIKNKKGA